MSIDSVHCHANWARDLGGVSFPLLSDFEPKGAVAKGLGHYLASAGITDRATVILDKGGVIRYSVSVTPSGERNIEDLASECEQVNSGQPAGDLTQPQPIPDGTVLYVKSKCGVSRRALVAVDNLHLRDRINVLNVTKEAAAASALERTGGKDQAPCLVLEGKPLYESAALITELANREAPLA